LEVPFFVLFPLQGFAPPYQPDSWWFQAADALNMDRNYFPSLHAAYAATCAYFLPRPLILVWSGGIVFSTFLTYQHYWVDAVAGVLFAVAVSWWTTKRGQTLAFCLGELVRCTLRNRRYGVIALALLAYTAVRPRRGWRGMVGFTYLQHLDDLLDGHLASSAEPLDIAREQVHEWCSDEFSNGRLSLAGASLKKTLNDEGEVPLIIEEMMVDRRRVRERAVLNEEALQKHLHKTFSLSLDLMLKASGAELRAANVPALAPLLGWCSVVRDLDEDLSLGLVNIPAEVWEKGDLKGWFEREHPLAEALFQKARLQLETVKHRSGYSLLSVFHRSVRKYLKNHEPEKLAQIAEAYREL
jgi:hypothetical protein